MNETFTLLEWNTDRADPKGLLKIQILGVLDKWPELDDVEIAQELIVPAWEVSVALREMAEAGIIAAAREAGKETNGPDSA